MIPSFTFNTTANIQFGPGTLGQLGPQAHNRRFRRVLLVTDQGMVATGIVERARQSLEDAGVAAIVFSGVKADPAEAIVLEAAEIARAEAVDGAVGLGGGSSLDVAKLVALLVGGSEELKSIYGVGKAKGPRLPLILIPTTSGTGSEVTPISIVTTGTAEKMGVVSPILLPDLTLLDPELTYGLPAPVTAATGIDAMVHAIEAYASASPNNNPLSKGLALQALKMMGGALLVAVRDGANAQARSEMLLGSMLAGQAFANSPVAAVHALAYPLGGHFHIPHGLSNALVLPHVLRFNCVTHHGPYAEMAPAAFPHLESLQGQERAAAFCEALADLSQETGLPQSLRAMSVTEDWLPKLASDAMNQTRLLVNNPRPLSETDALAIYRAAF